ncbi:hypothetical protein [Streptomyces longisporoflavus]|uniref:hypothetical protein n=1 Tax=Streptomyces longisporoflavus TaxID=28044 RepID=UPI00167EB5C3|nr:hypothetical protein [Streptomyces longisporoflavus]
MTDGKVPQPARDFARRQSPRVIDRQPLQQQARGRRACQPARCRNSVVTAAHAPVWLAEQEDLTRTLGDKRLAPARRAALHERLADVTRSPPSSPRHPDGRFCPY